MIRYAIGLAALAVVIIVAINLLEPLMEQCMFGTPMGVQGGVADERPPAWCR